MPDAKTINPSTQDGHSSRLITPDSFEPENHFYTKVLNATIHPLVSYFLRLDIERIINRHCHLNPQIDRKALEELLTYTPKFLRWAGADLFNVTTASGTRKMVIIETNSSPSGQKSMPLLAEHQEEGGYKQLIEEAFAPAVKQHRFKDGELAVIYDKNLMEVSGYAAAMANYFQHPVHLVPFFDSDPNPPARFVDDVLEIRDESGKWIKIRAAFRYVTQRPWNRIPIHTKTLIFNPIVACLAGGRNKMLASMAYEIQNAELAGSGLSVNIPETIRDVRKDEIPFIVKRFGGHAVIKIPYSNAGQGVFTITSPKELASFMEQDFRYERFIVQSLIGNYQWSSDGALGKFYHVGTVPNRNNEIHVADLRLMVIRSSEAYKPVAIYGRRARKPLLDKLIDSTDSWDMLGTNLSVKTGVDSWKAESSRLMLMDRKEFNLVGIGIDDLIQGFIQTVLAACAIDKFATSLFTSKGKFRMRAFKSLNDDPVLINEVLVQRQ